MILLLGDYSSVHYELAKALIIKGEKVIVMSDGDGYKKIKCDIQLPSLRVSKYKIFNKAAAIIRLSGLFGIKNYLVARREVLLLGHIDVAQIINPVVIPSLGAVGNLLLIRFLRKRVRKLSMCALGDDYSWVDACLKNRYKYSPFEKLRLGGWREIIQYMSSLKYVYSPLYRYLDFYARRNVDVIVPGLSDYKIAYRDNDKAIDVINIPIAGHNFLAPSPAIYPVKIFHAWQKGKENRKGNDVLDKIVRKYIAENGAKKIHYEVISNLSYEDYIKKYIDSDIILDQIYSYDCGVTAALGMAAGKVVFSGFESGHLHVGVNATPNESKLYNDFCAIIDSLELIWILKNNAYDFAKKNYDAEVVAGKYLKTWGLA